MRGPVVARSILRPLRGAGVCDAGCVDRPGCEALRLISGKSVSRGKRKDGRSWGPTRQDGDPAGAAALDPENSLKHRAGIHDTALSALSMPATKDDVGTCDKL